MYKDLSRYLNAQATTYQTALTEIQNGRKRSHWMWFIFPQILGLGHSETSKYYAIQNLEEAHGYLSHPILGSRLLEITTALLKQKSRSAGQIFGTPDDLKLKSCMTLFGQLPQTNPIFQQVLDEFFQGHPDQQTLNLIKKEDRNKA